MASLRIRLRCLRKPEPHEGFTNPVPASNRFPFALDKCIVTKSMEFCAKLLKKETYCYGVAQPTQEHQRILHNQLGAVVDVARTGVQHAFGIAGLLSLYGAPGMPGQESFCRITVVGRSGTPNVLEEMTEYSIIYL